MENVKLFTHTKLMLLYLSVTDLIIIDGIVLLSICTQ